MGSRALIAAALASLALSLGSCSGATADDTVTLRLWAMGREGEVVSELIPAFEREHPGIRVEVQQIPWTAAHEKLLTAYVGEATPDIAMLGNTWLPEFVALDALAPLDEMIAASGQIDPDDFFAGIWRTNVVDGSTYGIPWYVDTRLVFYRSDILSRAGYSELPETWAEWMTAMRKIKAQMTPTQYPMLMPTNEWPQLVGFALETGSPILANDGQYGAFQEPRFRQAFEFYLSFFREGLAPAVSSAQISNLFQEFERGNIAMYISGPWYIGEFRNRLADSVQDKWTTAPMPGIDGPGASMAAGASLSVFTGSPHKREAWLLIEYLSRPATQLEFYRLTGDLPPRKASWEDTLLINNEHARAFRDQLERVVPLPQVPEWEEIATTIFEHGERTIRGAATVDQTLAALDRDVNAILEKRRYLLAQAKKRK